MKKKIIVACGGAVVLFSNLQNKEFYHFLLKAPEDEITEHFSKVIFN